ncbi:iron-containing alcohol dehydrogenase [Puniceibacterium sp. IMCC21224]|uniref:iron-containing alcohol dehydrogenase n=1 Tax=Puniceibacterium sp. IMCC21224 TaxID=1618204 RepID=UPI00064DD688|nr:iron-containing alcohol dehydrogenase [Puniceibacterium sp. IMCC21224]KMK68836.1 alcohol dehydrogenase, class IV [Puniceibacterium sp. IMCC21224]
MVPFALNTPTRIIFGRGRAAGLPEEVAARGRRVLLVRGRSVAWADTCTALLRDLGCTVSVLHSAGEPDLPQIEAALARYRDDRPDCVLAIGGGATLDLAKALAALLPASRPPLIYLEGVGGGQPLDAEPLPFVACPTTSGTGAEATKNAVIGVPSHGRKVSLRDDRMLAVLALVDPALTDNCPRAVTLASGLDAITQVIEPYLSCRANALTDALCRDAIPRGLRALARLMSDEDADARDDMALTSLFGGIALANAGLGAVHGLAGVIGGRFATPHGAICGRLLAPVLRLNEVKVAEAGLDTMRFAEVRVWIATELGGNPADAFDTLECWATLHGLPTLRALMASEADVGQIAEESTAASSMRANPVPLAKDRLEQLLATELSG